MSKPKWYNWTGNSMWDGYCFMAWVFVIIPAAFFLLFIFLGAILGWVKVA